MDCAGPLIHVLKGLGFAYSDEKGYPRRPYKGMLERILDSQPHLKKVPNTDLRAGDMVLFRISTAPQHIAIYTDKDTIIHAYFHAGKVTEQSFAPWRNQLKHVYRFAE
jgi:cell wall-associated NlpC family hydrolase